MGYYSKITDARGVVRYRDENASQFVKTDEVPAEVKEALSTLEDGVKVTHNETGEVIVDEGTTSKDTGENSTVGTNEDSEVESAVPDPAAKPEDSVDAVEEDDEDDESGIDTEMAQPVVVSKTKEGMGFPMDKDGKTLSVFSRKPHEAIRFVAGHTVPMTIEEYNTKTDAEVIEKLKKLGKI